MDENRERTYPEIVAAILDYLTKTKVLTDTNPGSVVRTLVEAFSRELYEAYVKLGHIHDMAFVDTATGSALERLVAILGAKRIDGSVASGEVTFHRDPRVVGRIVIPASTELNIALAAGKQAVYHTVEDVELPNGQKEIAVAVQADLPPGEDDQKILITAEELKGQSPVVSMDKPIAGIAAMILRTPTAQRGLREKDEELRKRVKGLIEAVGGGTAKAIEQAVLATGKVKNVKILDPDENAASNHGSGRLRIRVDADDFAKNYAEIEQAVARVKGPGILIELLSVDFIEYGLELVLKPVTGQVTRKARAVILEQAAEVVKESFKSLGPGDALLWNRVLAKLLAIDGVLDIDGKTSKFVIITTKQKVDLADLTPTKSDEQIRLKTKEGGLKITLAGESLTEVRLSYTRPELSKDEREEKLKRAVTEALEPFFTELDIAKPLVVANVLTVLKGVEPDAADLSITLRTEDGAEATLQGLSSGEQSAGQQGQSTYSLRNSEVLVLSKTDSVTMTYTTSGNG